MWAENGYKERATATTHKMATQTNATEQTLHNTLNGQQLTTHTGRHRRRNTLDSGPWAPAAVSRGNNSGLKKLFLLEANTVEKQSVG